jgi:tRNA-specific 2-thiouridylase
VDATKDQSYFLWRIGKEVLPFVLFPIGDTLKSQVRREAERAGIPTFAKADSQGVCFLGDINMKEFLRHFISLTEGQVLSQDGTQVGVHSGALLYTIGERHGFSVETKKDTNTAHYVISRDLEKNTITVGTEPLMLKSSDKIRLTDTRQLGRGFADTMEAQFRYRQVPIPVRIEMEDTPNGILTLAVNNDIAAPMRGQSCVMYRGDECCGGGVISY